MCRRQSLAGVVLLAGFFMSVWSGAQEAAQNGPPVISHKPVVAAVRGQAVTVLANVTDDSGLVKSVTLFYSLSKDAAPFRIVMKPSAGSVYYGTIPQSMLTGDSVSYYIEAMDYVDATSETAWYVVEMKDVVAKAREKEPVVVPPPAKPSRASSDEGGSRWLGVGIIAGGAAAVLGGALLVAADGGDDSSSGGGGGGGVEAGRYSGSVTECFTPAGGTASCASHGIAIDISSSGLVSSDNLNEGMYMETSLHGTEFTLMANLSGPGVEVTGQVAYVGTVVDNRIVGSISGDGTSSAGAGTFSGTFSATK